jgi:hypothetical protein
MEIWNIVSFEEYNKQTTLLPFLELTRYQESLGYKTPEEFFEMQSIAAQDIVNSRVGNIIGNVFKPSELPNRVQFELKRFTYATMDFLRFNDSIIIERIRQSSTTHNNSRTDVTQIEANSLEKLFGGRAWRAWMSANIESLYLKWSEDNGINFLLDPTKFYDKVDIDSFLAQLEEEIENEHQYIDHQVDGVIDSLNQFNKKLDDKVSYLDDKKQNKIDQKLYQQETDEDGNPTGNVEELGKFDEILIQDRFAKNTIITTDNNKKRAIININADFGAVVNATTYQTSSETDNVNPIGRQWAKGIENELTIHDSRIKTHGNELKNVGDFLNEKGYWIKGQIIQVEQGTVNEMPTGWKKLTKPGTSTRYTISSLPPARYSSFLYVNGIEKQKMDFFIYSVVSTIENEKEFIGCAYGWGFYKITESGFSKIEIFDDLLLNPEHSKSISLNKEKNGYIIVDGDSGAAFNTFDNSLIAPEKTAMSMIYDSKLDDYIFVPIDNFNQIKRLSNNETILEDKNTYFASLLDFDGRTAYMDMSDLVVYFIDDQTEVPIPDFISYPNISLDRIFFEPGLPYTSTIDDLVFEYWRYDPNDEFKKVNINNNNYWNEAKQRSAEIKKELELKKQLATKKEVIEIQNQVTEIKPIVWMLDKKEAFRMKMLGIDPNDKYYEEGDNDE